MFQRSQNSSSNVIRELAHSISQQIISTELEITAGSVESNWSLRCIRGFQNEFGWLCCRSFACWLDDSFTFWRLLPFCRGQICGPQRIWVRNVHRLQNFGSNQPLPITELGNALDFALDGYPLGPCTQVLLSEVLCCAVDVTPWGPKQVPHQFHKQRFWKHSLGPLIIFQSFFPSLLCASSFSADPNSLHNPRFHLCDFHSRRRF
mmetsp:Transcript_1553/g.2224  ORF Transcript_1553/g.2224 Transcript_1553/m.2224 type:complete len:205 (-) Transcript_1553:251-865(-)